MIQLNYRDAKPIYEQIKDGMRHLVISNALTADEKLPSVRELAATLAINPNTIQRAFILDSLSLNNLSGQLEQGKPDFVEILPGIMPRVITEISTRTRVPVIAGGLLRDKADVMAAMRAGASAVSTSAPELWDI